MMTGWWMMAAEDVERQREGMMTGGAADIGKGG